MERGKKKEQNKSKAGLEEEDILFPLKANSLEKRPTYHVNTTQLSWSRNSPVLKADLGPIP